MNNWEIGGLNSQSKFGASPSGSPGWLPVSGPSPILFMFTSTKNAATYGHWEESVNPSFLNSNTTTVDPISPVNSKVTSVLAAS